MSKKKKAKRRKSKKHNKPNKQHQGNYVQSSGNVEKDLMTAVFQGRGRRAVTLVSKLGADSSINDEKCTLLTAVAYEAYIRGLLTDNHYEKALSESTKFYKTNPNACNHWALSLQILMQLIPNVAVALQNNDWRNQLRIELVDPHDLKNIDDIQIRQDATRIIDAWSLIDSGGYGDARKLLSNIGRHSLLVDWRLFLHGYLAAIEGNNNEVAVATKRIMNGTPAAVLLSEMIACRDGDEIKLNNSMIATSIQSGNENFAELSQKFSAEYEKNGITNKLLGPFTYLAQSLFSTKRMDALACLICSIFTKIQDNEHARPFMKSLVAMGVNPDRAIQYTFYLFSKSDWPSEIEYIYKSNIWTRHERAVLLLVSAQIRQYEFKDDCDENYPCLDDIMKDDIEELNLIGKTCARCAESWPELRAIYEIWNWVEGKNGGVRAVKAEARAFPDDISVLSRLTKKLADKYDFKFADRTIEKLAKLPGGNAEVDILQQYIIYSHVKKYFDKNNGKEVKKWADAYKGNNFFERVDIAVRMWLMATNKKEKRKCGIEMDKLDSPWLVFFFCAQLNETNMTEAKLPASIRKSLKNSPLSVLTGFMDLAKWSGRTELDEFTTGLVKVIFNALNDKRIVQTDIIIQVLYELVMRDWHDLYYQIFYTYQEQFLGATHRLLSNDDNSPAVVYALVFRMYLHAGDYLNTAKERVLEELLEVADSLASDSQTKTIVTEAKYNFDIPIYQKADLTKKRIKKVLKRERSIATSKDFILLSNKLGYFERPNSNFNNQFPDIIKRLMENHIEDIYNDEINEDYPIDDYPQQLPTVKKYSTINLSNFFPAVELEFEKMINSIELNCNPDTFDVLKVELLEKLAQSSLLPKSKIRVKNKILNIGK